MPNNDAQAGVRRILADDRCRPGWRLSISTKIIVLFKMTMWYSHDDLLLYSSILTYNQANLLVTDNDNAHYDFTY